jgi:hypothetical protein
MFHAQLIFERERERQTVSGYIQQLIIKKKENSVYSRKSEYIKKESKQTNK